MIHNYIILDGNNDTLASVYIPSSCYNMVTDTWDSLGQALVRYVRYEAKNNPVHTKNTNVRWTDKSWFERMQNKEMLPSSGKVNLKTKLAKNGIPLPRPRNKRGKK